MAWIAGLTETGAGLMLAAGLLTPFASTAFIGMSLNIAVAGHEHVLWNYRDGYEFPLTIGLGSALFAFAGPGRYSLDSSFGWELWGTSTGLLCSAVGVAMGGAFLLLRRTHQTAEAQTAES